VTLPPRTLFFDTAARHRLDPETALPAWFSGPVDWLETDDASSVIPLLERAEEHRRSGRWVGGFVAYEAAAAWGLPVQLPAPGQPLLMLGVYDAPSPPPLLPDSAPPAVRIDPVWNEAAHARAHERVRRLIREGDVYQINLTFPLRAAFEAREAWTLYQRARARQPVAFGAFLQGEGSAVGSLSPELFFRTDASRIWARPMKGTLPAGADPARLTGDAKSRAENLMIVDLLRNDLSRVSEPGSVQVPALFDVEQHPTVLQMTSTVEGRLRRGVGAPELFEALFPCGSVTGAPKQRAMQRIAEIEDGPRGVYCGAVGMLAPDGRSVFSVAIRTFVAQSGTLTLGVGSGVVWDSVASDEYAECLLKARFLADA
jgi:para-aminobenzoate synthetase component 1